MHAAWLTDWWISGNTKFRKVMPSSPVCVPLSPWSSRETWHELASWTLVQLLFLTSLDGMHTAITRGILPVPSRIIDMRIICYVPCDDAHLKEVYAAVLGCKMDDGHGGTEGAESIPFKPWCYGGSQNDAAMLKEQNTRHTVADIAMPRLFRCTAIVPGHKQTLRGSALHLHRNVLETTGLYPR